MGASFARLDQARVRGDAEAGHGSPLDITLLKPLGKRGRTGGCRQGDIGRGMQAEGQLQPEPPAAGLHGGG